MVGLVFPVVAGTYSVSLADLGLGALAHLTATCAGIAIGLVCSRLVIGRPGYSLFVALGLVLLMLLVRGLPPMNPMFRLMSGDRDPSDLLLPVTGLAVVAILLLMVAGLVTQSTVTRRD